MIFFRLNYLGSRLRHRRVVARFLHPLFADAGP